MVGRVTQALAARPCRAADTCVDLDELGASYPQVRSVIVEEPETMPGTEVTGVRSPRLRRELARPWRARAARVLEIPGGVVFGRRGWIGLDPGHLLVTGDMAPWTLPRNDIRRYVDRQRRGAPVDLPGRTASLLNAGGHNYSHTLLQAMPLLDAVDRAVGLDRIDRFLVQDDARPYTLELARRWGIDDDRLERVPVRPVRYRCETLVTGTLPASSGLGPRSVVVPVRERFAAELAAASGADARRWYLTRSPRWARRVENEEAVEAMLSRRGFETLVTDGLTVAEQASLLARSEFVVGVHGAALANLVFAPPGTPVLELMPANMRSTMYARLSVAAGLRYDMVTGREPSPPSSLHLTELDADLVVDVDDLAARVDSWLPG